MQKTRTVLIVLLTLFLIGGIVFAASDTVRFVVLSTVSAVLYGFPSEVDRSDAQMLREKIISVHSFTRDSPSQPGQAPVFFNVGSKQLLRTPTMIQVYDVQDRAEQDKIVSAVQQLAAERRLPPFELCFYDHENWMTSGALGMRGDENQLRCLSVTSSHAREVSGAKIITHPSP